MERKVGREGVGRGEGERERRRKEGGRTCSVCTTFEVYIVFIVRGTGKTTEREQSCIGRIASVAVDGTVDTVRILLLPLVLL